ncbi:MAG: isoprenylcysteine carboxylmethyltransferase family protein [Actinobacteria bacterium]|nr:isoprenylcysteine carboxylmethyltransferase family protein [Actinomycetota bacterium]
MQAFAGLAWWICVFTLDPVREATLGGADPVLVAAVDLPLFVAASALAARGLRWACWIAVPWTLIVALALVIGATLTGKAGWGALAMLAASAGGVSAWLLMTQSRIPAERVLIGPLGFRVAASRARGRQVARTFAQLTAFWVFFLLLLPGAIGWFEMRWGLRLVPTSSPVASFVLALGAILLLLASALGIWAAITMSTLGDGTPLPSATARRLVIAGPYLFVRNPMALAGIVQAAGVGLMLGSWLVVLYALCGAAYWNWLVRPFEEQELAQRFGAPYNDYRTRVRCWIPTPPSRAGGPAA